MLSDFAEEIDLSKIEAAIGKLERGLVNTPDDDECIEFLNLAREQLASLQVLRDQLQPIS